MLNSMFIKVDTVVYCHQRYILIITSQRVSKDWITQPMPPAPNVMVTSLEPPHGHAALWPSARSPNLTPTLLEASESKSGGGKDDRV